MNSFNGWPIIYTGIVLIAIGSWINKGIDAALIVAGLCLVICGIIKIGLFLIRND